jgi:hypothetical protein
LATIDQLTTGWNAMNYILTGRNDTFGGNR